MIVNLLTSKVFPLVSLFVLMHFYASLRLSRTIKISKTRTQQVPANFLTVCMRKVYITKNNESRVDIIKWNHYFLQIWHQRFYACLTFPVVLRVSLFF